MCNCKSNLCGCGCNLCCNIIKNIFGITYSCPAKKKVNEDTTENSIASANILESKVNDSKKKSSVKKTSSKTNSVKKNSSTKKTSKKTKSE